VFYNCNLLQQYDSVADLSPDAPDVIAKGDGDLVEILAFITEPAASVSLTVFQPLGYDVSVT
jgi:hypothetical protein